MKVVLALFVIVLISPSSEAKLPYGFSIDLIHRDSHLSPFYNSSMNQSQALINAAMRSISRANTLFYLTTTAYGMKSQALLIETQGSYLMKYSVGNPPVDSFGIIDTGSDLIWMQCRPCRDCFHQDPTIFDPTKSSTYQVVSCQTDTCDLLHDRLHACGDRSVCRYEINYGDESLTSGELVNDTISFGPFQQVVSPNTLFGCGHVNYGTFTSASTGVVGLGQGPLSLVSQFGSQIDHKFSYCLVPQWSKVPSKLKFGWEADLFESEIVTVPFWVRYPYSFYHLRLYTIYIGKTAVRPTGSSDMILDCGATLTFLETSLYDKFEAAIKKEYRGNHKQQKNPPEPFKLCYLYGKIKDVPDVTFIFSMANKGLRLNASNVFRKIDYSLCLMVAPTKGRSVFGSTAQVDFKVSYDLHKKQVSFARADCTKV